jgi:hypothetical protein
VGHHNAQEIRDHKKHVNEQLLKIEVRQKEIMAKYDMPHSPLRAPMDFPPPLTFYNPWEEIEDLGGHEESNEGEEEDIPAANTPIDEEEDDEDDDDDDK